MKYKEIIIDIMRLIYNNDNSNKEEIIKQLQRDLPDEIRKENQKKLIKELEREVKEYVANASDYRTMGINSRIKYQTNLPKSISYSVFTSLNGIIDTRDELLQDIVRKMQAAAVQKELDLIKVIRHNYTKSYPIPHEFTSTMFQQELFLTGLKERIKILDRLEKSNIVAVNTKRKISFSPKSKRQILKTEKARNEYLTAQLAYQTIWTTYNEAMLQNELMYAKGMPAQVPQEEIVRLQYETAYSRLEVEKQSISLQYITGDITRQDYIEQTRKTNQKQQELNVGYNNKHLAKQNNKKQV